LGSWQNTANLIRTKVLVRHSTLVISGLTEKGGMR
jgi:hypothetical protein